MILQDSRQCHCAKIESTYSLLCKKGGSISWSLVLTPQLLAHRLHTRALAQNTRDTRRNPLGRGTSRMSHVDDHMLALSLSLAFFRQLR